MITVISAMSMPSLSQYEHTYDAWNTPAYNVFTYLSSSKGEISNVFGILTRLQLLKALADHGNEPFFGADLFGSCDSLGGWMCGLSIYNIIKETGNTREVMVQIDGDLYRQCHIKEWKLAIDSEVLRNLIDEFRAELLNLI